MPEAPPVEAKDGSENGGGTGWSREEIRKSVRRYWAKKGWNSQEKKWSCEGVEVEGALALFIALCAVCTHGHQFILL